MIDNIVSLVEDMSYFTFDGIEDDEQLIFSTRENGDVGSETPSRIDYKEGLKVVKEIKSKYPTLSVEIEVVDEWIMIFVS